MRKLVDILARSRRGCMGRLDDVWIGERARVRGTSFECGLVGEHVRKYFVGCWSRHFRHRRCDSRW